MNEATKLSHIHVEPLLHGLDFPRIRKAMQALKLGWEGSQEAPTCHELEWRVRELVRQIHDLGAHEVRGGGFEVWRTPHHYGARFVLTQCSEDAA